MYSPSAFETLGRFAISFSLFGPSALELDGCN